MNSPTGRTPSTTPNLQNLSTGSEEGKRVAAAFRPGIDPDPFVPGHISVAASPKFWISLAPVHIEYLMLMSRHHYDGRCKQASADVGGFITGWANWARVAPDARHSMSMDELDTLMKICENISVLDTNFKRAEVHLLVRLLNRAFTLAQAACSAVSLELMPETLAPSERVSPGYSPY